MTEKIPEITKIPVSAITIPELRPAISVSSTNWSPVSLILASKSLLRSVDATATANLTLFVARVGSKRSLPWDKAKYPRSSLMSLPGGLLFLVMSLVENLARRHHSSLELMSEIGNLKKRGYSINQIAAKTDFSAEYVQAICHLLEHGEERLLTAIERGLIPHSIAMEIARAKEGDVQKALADAYESGDIPGNQILAIRKIIEQRNLTGKGIHVIGKRQPERKRITSVTLVRAYRKETDRQKLLVRKAGLAQGRLLFVVNALRILLNEPLFVKLLRGRCYIPHSS